MKELSIRAVTGAIYVAITLGAALAGPFTTALVFLPVCMLGARELHRLAMPDVQGAPLVWSMLLAGATHIAISVVAIPGGWSIGAAATWCFMLLLISIAWMLLRGTRDPAAEVGTVLMTLVLLGVPFGMLAHFFAQGEHVMIGFMVLLWTNDTGAYLVGRSLGRRLLLPSVSPKKTVEGLVGGITLTLLVAWSMAYWLPALALDRWLACGAIIALTSTMGDLLESAFKRARGVKDSGDLLPGHGGILDRFDGFLLAAPATLLYLYFLS